MAADYSLITSFNALAERQVTDKILSCNETSEKYGLTLTPRQAQALSQTRTAALSDTKRIELGGGIVDRLILAFCTSPYMTKDNYESTLHELVSLFYELKNETWDTVSDDDLIAFMQKAFNDYCHGSLELLSGKAAELCEHIHRGGRIDTFSLEDT